MIADEKGLSIVSPGRNDNLWLSMDCGLEMRCG